MKKFLEELKSFLLGAQGIPLVLLIIVFSFMFVFFRMKGIEQEYKAGELQKKIEHHNIDNKELKAERARLMSNKHLKNLAERHGMKEPKQDQIIVIP